MGLEGEDSQGPERGKRELSVGEAQIEEMGTSDSVSADMCMYSALDPLARLVRPS